MIILPNFSRDLESDYLFKTTPLENKTMKKQIVY